MNDDKFSSTFSANARLSSDDVIASLTQGLPAVDAARSERYGNLALMRDAKANSLSKEQRLLAIKSGPNHPRIAQAAEAFVANESYRKEIAVVREVIETSAPSIDDNTFVVYGFVRRRSTQAGIPGLTVALTDDNGNWVRQFGYACTDKRGYFELAIDLSSILKKDSTVGTKANLTEEEKRKLEAEKAAGGAASSSSGSSTAGTGAANAISTTLRVFNKDGQTVHTEKNPVDVKPASLDYRVILLDDGDENCGCTPPPAQSGAKPSPVGPLPNQPAPTNTPLKPTTAAAPQERVAGLKSYPASTPTPSASGQPLEAIRGIGPKGAAKLRTAGIADVAAFEKTSGQKLVDIAGFDKTQPKSITSKEKNISSNAPKKSASSKSKEAKK